MLEEESRDIWRNKWEKKTLGGLEQCTKGETGAVPDITTDPAPCCTPADSCSLNHNFFIPLLSHTKVPQSVFSFLIFFILLFQCFYLSACPLFFLLLFKLLSSVFPLSMHTSLFYTFIIKHLPAILLVFCFFLIFILLSLKYFSTFPPQTVSFFVFIFFFPAKRC